MVIGRGMGCLRLLFRLLFRVDRLTACTVGPEVAVFGHLRQRAAPMHALLQLANTNMRKKTAQMAKQSMITRVCRRQPLHTAMYQRRAWHDAHSSLPCCMVVSPTASDAAVMMISSK